VPRIRAARQRRAAQATTGRRRSPFTLLARKHLLSESGCRAGSRTRRCSATAWAWTASALTRAASRSRTAG
jgi:hypothetical protein